VSNRAAAQALAKRQAMDVDRVVARSGVVPSRIWQVAADAARARKVKGKIRPFDETIVAAAVQELTDVMSFTYLMRLRLGKRRRRQARGLTLASPVHTAAAQIAGQFEIDLGNISKRFEPIAGKAIKSSMKSIRDVMNDALEEATIGGLTSGDAVEEVLQALQDHGITARSNAYVETLVRTHSSIAYGAAHKVSYQNDVDLWGFEYVTVGDDRVREEHEILDGTKRKAGDPFWDRFWPPNGWNCRCQAIAIYDDEERQTPVPDDAEPDDGFDFDPAELVE